MSNPDSTVSSLPYFKMLVSYDKDIQQIIDTLRLTGMKVEIIKEIKLQTIHRHNHQPIRHVQPWFLSVDKEELSPEDMVKIVEDHNLVADFDAVLEILQECVNSEMDEKHNYRYISPLKVFLDDKQEQFQWVFCILQKIKNKFFLYINGFSDNQDRESLIVGEEIKKILAFRHLNIN